MTTVIIVFIAILIIGTVVAIGVPTLMVTRMIVGSFVIPFMIPVVIVFIAILVIGTVVAIGVPTLMVTGMIVGSFVIPFMKTGTGMTTSYA
jgi:hypothetical protein